MKKNSLFLCFIFLVCTVSCRFYSPTKDYKKRLSKVEYKSFDSLNDPMIFKFEALLNFKPGPISRKNGSFYVIYDWQNNTIYDYVYSANDNCDSQIFLVPSINSNNNLEYFTFDCNDKEKLKVFSMTNTKNTIEESVLNNLEILNFVDIQNTNSQNAKDHLILVNKLPSEINFMYFDVNSKNITKSKAISVEDYETDIFIDSNDTCWYLERFEKKDLNKIYARICSYDFNTDTEANTFIEFDCVGDSIYDNFDGWINEDFYHFEYIDSDYIICKKNSHDKSKANQSETTSIVFINRKNNSTKEIKLDNPEDFLRNLVKIQNDYYSVIQSSDKKIKINKINQETLDSTLLAEIDNLNYTKIEVKNNRIYFINITNGEIQKAKIQYFDIFDNKFYENKEIILEEYFEKLGV